MTKNPFMNALYAVTYIAGVVSIIFYSPNFLDASDGFLIIPVAMLSLLVLSVATMAFLFFYQPFLLFAAGKKEEAAAFFVRTLIAFAGVTIVIGIILAAISFQASLTQPVSTAPSSL